VVVSPFRLWLLCPSILLESLHTLSSLTYVLRILNSICSWADDTSVSSLSASPGPTHISTLLDCTPFSYHSAFCGLWSIVCDGMAGPWALPHLGTSLASTPGGHNDWISH
jgi:hypothetical protein